MARILIVSNLRDAQKVYVKECFESMFFGENNNKQVNIILYRSLKRRKTSIIGAVFYNVVRR
jgi:hypothetical protein